MKVFVDTCSFIHIEHLESASSRKLFLGSSRLHNILLSIPCTVQKWFSTFVILLAAPLPSDVATSAYEALLHCYFCFHNAINVYWNYAFVRVACSKLLWVVVDVYSLESGILTMTILHHNNNWSGVLEHYVRVHLYEISTNFRVFVVCRQDASLLFCKDFPKQLAILFSTGKNWSKS